MKRYEVEIVDSNGTTRYGMDTQDDARVAAFVAKQGTDGSVAIHDLEAQTTDTGPFTVPPDSVRYETARRTG